MVHLDGATRVEALAPDLEAPYAPRSETCLETYFEKVSLCAVCGASADDSSPVFAVQQLFWQVSVHRCHQCGLVYKSWRPREVVLQAIYRGDYSNFHPVSDGTDQAAELTPRVERLGTPRGRHLDIGCGDGAFVAVARGKGFDSHGIDPFLPDVPAHLAPFMRKGDILDETFRHQLGTFDLISLWAVWEHLPNPMATMTAAVEVLNPGGRLVLNCPHGRSLHATRRGSSWRMATLLEHLTFLTVPTCRYIAARLALDVSRVRYCGSPYPFATNARGATGQGLTNSALERIFHLEGAASRSHAAAGRQASGPEWPVIEHLRVQLMSTAKIPFISNTIRHLLNATQIGDHVELYLERRRA
jgi:2-polyprenyl-3-methyl-5-hydroxy-6-metoxy-1,4-benzoquinol methylase